MSDFEKNYLQDIQINKNNLDEEWLKLPELFAKWFKEYYEQKNLLSKCTSITINQHKIQTAFENAKIMLKALEKKEKALEKLTDLWMFGYKTQKSSIKDKILKDIKRN